MKVPIIVLALMLMAAQSPARANYIYGTIMDHEGNPLEGIPVSFLDSEGITDADGFYVAGDAAGVTHDGVLWGSIKAQFKDKPEFPRFQAAFQETTDTLYINLGTGRDTTYWSAKCVVTVSGELEFDGALPVYWVTVPNNPDLTGPQDVRITPADFHDTWNINDIDGSSYDELSFVDPTTFPRVTFSDAEAADDPEAYAEIYYHAVATGNELEFYLGKDIYDFMPYGWLHPDYPNSGTWIAILEGWGTCETWMDGDWVTRSKVYINDEITHFTNHELGYRAFTHNIACHVTTWAPSNYATSPGDIQLKDLGVVLISIDIKERLALGENDIRDADYINVE